MSSLLRKKLDILITALYILVTYIVNICDKNLQYHYGERAHINPSSANE